MTVTRTTIDEPGTAEPIKQEQERVILMIRSCWEGIEIKVPKISAINESPPTIIPPASAAVGI